MNNQYVEYTCDLCGLYKTKKYIDPTIERILWCGSCQTKHLNELISLGLIVNTIDHMLWSIAGSVAKLKDLKNRIGNQPAVASIPSAKIIAELKPCERKYYGLKDCTCNKCPPLRRVLNTNPFQY